MDERASGSSYWDSEILQRESTPRDSTWYQYMEEVYGNLIARASGGSVSGPSLKTDLYEEARGSRSPLWHLPSPRVGVDLSPEIVSAARKNHGCQSQECELLVADVRDLPFPDNHFGCVLSGSTLDHFERREEILVSLRELGRVLAPGGVLVLTLDNPHNPLLYLRSRFGKLSGLRLRPYFVGETLTRRQGVAALKAAGLQVRSVRAVSHAPRDPAMRFARLRDRASNKSAKKRFVQALMRFEALERAPSRWRTGYYLAFEAVKPGPANGPATELANDASTLTRSAV